jgi:hypothetical protein
MKRITKFLFLPAVPLLGALTIAAPAGAATAHHVGPLAHTAGMRAPAVRQTTAGPASVSGSPVSNTYVSTTGTDVDSVCAQVDPCRTITYAETLTVPGGTIHVAAGTYNQTANLTEPVTLQGAGESKTIIDGSNIDEGAMGYYGVIGIDNSSGTAGTITVTSLTVRHPYVTATEYSDDQAPIDISNFDKTQTGDTVDVTAVKLGPAQDEATYDGIGYYSLNSVSTNHVSHDYAHGMYEAYFAEGTGGTTSFSSDMADQLVGDSSTSTYYPPAGIFALADTSGALDVTATYDQFHDYNGWGIVGSAGYASGNCTNNTCTGGLTLGTNHNYFDLLKAPANSGVAAIAAYASANDYLTGNFNYSTGSVVSPDMTVSVVNDGGTVTVTDSHNTIKVLKH